MLKRLLRNEKGFTMVEMMVVMVIIAILVAGGIKFYQSNIEKARITKAKAQISTMQAALETYYAENGKYPNGDKLKTEMLDAGLVVVEVPEGQTDSVLDVNDPWGQAYLYKSANGKGFYVRTGYNNVQGQEGTAVYGNGKEGGLSVLTVGTPEES